MGAIKAILIAVAALFVIGGVILAQAAIRFDLALNPIVAPIRTKVGPWGEMTALTPAPFSIGEDGSKIRSRLDRAGFARVPDGEVWQIYADEIGAGYELYTREGNDLICAKGYYAFVSFGAHGDLLSAKGTVHEHGCL